MDGRDEKGSHVCDFKAFMSSDNSKQLYEWGGHVRVKKNTVRWQRKAHEVVNVEINTIYLLESGNYGNISWLWHKPWANKQDFSWSSLTETGLNHETSVFSYTESGMH